MSTSIWVSKLHVGRFVIIMLKIKTVLTRNYIIKYCKLSIGMCQSSSANLLSVI